MAYFLFDKKHLKEYAAYGAVAGICHGLTVWYFLQQSGNGSAAMLFIGSIFFMFVIMFYAIRLAKLLPDNKRTWGMLISGQIVVLTGMIISVTCSIILCSIYKPVSGYLSLIFVTATFENYGAGAFISSMVAYALKPDQTTDRTPEIFEELADGKSGGEISDDSARVNEN
jgi:hypothetical protein